MGDDVGAFVLGASVGTYVGTTVGTFVLGAFVGASVGVFVLGASVRANVGVFVLGACVGTDDGAFLIGASVGGSILEGEVDGLSVRACRLGAPVGTTSSAGATVGVSVGECVGTCDGSREEGSLGLMGLESGAFVWIGELEGRYVVAIGVLGASVSWWSDSSLGEGVGDTGGRGKGVDCPTSLLELTARLFLDRLRVAPSMTAAAIAEKRTMTAKQITAFLLRRG